MATQLAVAGRIRRFNRFYTQRMGLLNAGLLQSPLSLAEVRVLYEIAHLESPTAGAIAGALDLDAGYLSRLLRRLQQRRLVAARAVAEDRRRRRLTLTARGRKAFEVLDARADAEVAELLRDIPPARQEDLLASIGTIEELLGAPESASSRTPEVTLRAPEPGDLGWVVQRHGELYAEEYGWNADFERLVARIVGEFGSAVLDCDARWPPCRLRLPDVGFGRDGETAAAAGGALGSRPRPWHPADRCLHRRRPRIRLPHAHPVD
jgi:DNA-binding MarR family transcriptional regulator